MLVSLANQSPINCDTGFYNRRCWNIRALFISFIILRLAIMIGSPDSQSFRTGSAARFWCCWALCITIFLWPRINGHQPHRRGLTPAGPGQHHMPWRRSGGDQRRQLEPPGRAIVGWKMVAVNAVNRCKSLLLTPSRFVRRRSFWW